MKVRKGWLVTLNEDTKKMIPFFVKVRSQDIISTDPIDITAALKQTSTRWNLVRKEDRTELTYYRYEANWNDSYDVNAETVGSDFMDSYIDYYLYKDGRLEVDGIIRASGVYTAIDENYGSCTGLSTAVTISPAKITNQKLNLNLSDATEYNFLMKLIGILPANNTLSSAIPLENIRTIMEANATYAEADYASYIKTYFPFHIHYNGFWRSHESVIIDEAESHDDSLTGTYLTTAPVNMLSGADTKSTKVRSLATKTSVKCFGYYTETEEGKFLLCQYQPTSQMGYILSDYLNKQ